MKDNVPFVEAAETADQHIRAGHTIFQKFTCSACGARQTMPVPNAFYVKGRCEECNHITDLIETGCNYMLLIGNQDGIEFIKQVIKDL